MGQSYSQDPPMTEQKDFKQYLIYFAILIGVCIICQLFVYGATPT